MTRRRRLLHALIGHARAHRALDETLLDIRAESADAQRPWDRALWFGRSTVALMRVAIRIAPLDLRAIAPGGWMIRTAAWTALLLVLMMAASWMRLAQQTRIFDASTQAVLFAALMPAALAFVLPVALFLVAIWPPRRSSSPPALQAMIAAAIVLLMVLVTPGANQTFRSVYDAASTGAAVTWDVPRPGLRELPARALVRKAFAGEGGSGQAGRARQHLLAQAGLMALAGALALLGALVRRTRNPAPGLARRVWPYAAAVPPLALAAIMLGGPWGLWAAAVAALGLAVRMALSPARQSSIRMPRRRRRNPSSGCAG